MSKSLKTSIDRFTSLPQHVAHKIITFLSLEDRSRLSVVSRTCRQLCISMPSLTVNDRPYLEKTTKRTQLMNYVDRLLLLRGGMVTRSFLIYWNIDQRSTEEEDYRVISWLHNAVICNVKELVLVLILKKGSNFAFPTTLFGSKCLVSLRVDISNGILNFITNSTIGFSSLKRLRLTNVQIDESFGKWISTCCKFLKKLVLKRIKQTKRIVINSSSLIHLYISSTDSELLHIQVSAKILKWMGLCWRFDSLNNRVLQLSTPKLGELKWEGNIPNLQFKANFKCLKNVGLHLSPYFGVNSTIHNQVYGLVCNVRSLCLDEVTLQVSEKKKKKTICKINYVSVI